MPANWRTGRKVPLNVYEGDRPVCQCHTPEDAARIVDGMNAVEGANFFAVCPYCRWRWKPGHPEEHSPYCQIRKPKEPTS